jgi:cell division protein FtsB
MPDTKEETKPTETKPVETSPLLEEAKATAAELRKLLDENKAVKAELERLRANEILKGKAEAGQTIPEQKPETPQEYARRIIGAR